MSSSWEVKYGRGRPVEENTPDKSDIIQYLKAIEEKESSSAASAIRLLKQTFLNKSQSGKSVSTEQVEDGQVGELSTPEPERFSSSSTSRRSKNSTDDAERRLHRLVQGEARGQQEGKQMSPLLSTSRGAREDGLFSLRSIPTQPSRKARHEAERAVRREEEEKLEARRIEKREKAQRVRRFRRGKLFERLNRAFLEWRDVSTELRRERLLKAQKLKYTRKQLLEDLEEIEAIQRDRDAEVMKRLFCGWKRRCCVAPLLKEQAVAQFRLSHSKKVFALWKGVVALRKKKEEALRRRTLMSMAIDMNRVRLLRGGLSTWVKQYKALSIHKSLLDDEKRRSARMGKFLNTIVATREQRLREQQEIAEKEAARLAREKEEELREEERLRLEADVSARERKEHGVSRSQSLQSVRDRLSKADKTREFQRSLEEKRQERKLQLLQHKESLRIREHQKKLEEKKKAVEARRIAAEKERERQLQEERQLQQAKQAKIKTKRISKEQTRLAQMHYLRSTVLVRGWFPWMKLMEHRRKQQEKADEFARSHRRKRLFFRLRACCKIQREERFENARFHRQKQLAASVFHVLSRAVKERKEKEALAISSSSVLRMRSLFRAWKKRKVYARVRRATVLMEASSFTNRCVLRRAFIALHQNVEEKRELRRVSSKIEDTWSKVSMWLSSPPSGSSKSRLHSPPKPLAPTVAPTQHSRYRPSLSDNRRYGEQVILSPTLVSRTAPMCVSPLAASPTTPSSKAFHF